MSARGEHQRRRLPTLHGYPCAGGVENAHFRRELLSIFLVSTNVNPDCKSCSCTPTRKLYPCARGTLRLRPCPRPVAPPAPSRRTPPVTSSSASPRAPSLPATALRCRAPHQRLRLYFLSSAQIFTGGPVLTPGAVSPRLPTPGGMTLLGQLKPLVPTNPLAPPAAVDTFRPRAVNAFASAPARVPLPTLFGALQAAHGQAFAFGAAPAPAQPSVFGAPTQAAPVQAQGFSFGAATHARGDT
ncbi:hypothetical protein FB451DRAFT_1195889 [Mycena latifolia]|nr:hypothetical protein FB451DRAFT_1195889 [Mycena latifolia]